MSGLLYEAVGAYLKKDAARFHMPGHKGRGVGPLAGVLPWDITEVDGADSLFHADGPIRALEEQFAAVYGAKRSLLSAGGATLCIQTMLALACRPGQKVIMARNIHRAAVNACALLDLEPVWVYPERDAGAWFSGRCAPESIRKALGENPDASAVYVTSPDYFGVACDLRSLADVCAEYGIPLLVDNAHGAHLKFLEEPNAAPHPMDCGTDLCCDSLHKTMPAMTGGALLHIGDARFAERAKRMMSVFGSTSPSYPIMLSCEDALNYARTDARREFSETARQLSALGALLAEKGFSAPEGPCDAGKLAVCFAAAGMEAEKFGARLREAGIEPEYMSGTACVLMANGRNRRGDFERLERFIQQLPQAVATVPPSLNPPRPERALSVREALFSTQETILVENSEGRIAGAEVSPCPPGIPVVMPGERIDGAVRAALESYGVQAVPVLSQS